MKRGFLVDKADEKTPLTPCKQISNFIELFPPSLKLPPSHKAMENKMAGTAILLKDFIIIKN